MADRRGGLSTGVESVNHSSTVEGLSRDPSAPTGIGRVLLGALVVRGLAAGTSGAGDHPDLLVETG
jgi:hypothetical protein